MMSIEAQFKKHYKEDEGMWWNREKLRSLLDKCQKLPVSELNRILCVCLEKADFITSAKLLDVGAKLDGYVDSTCGVITHPFCGLDYFPDEGMKIVQFGFKHGFDFESEHTKTILRACLYYDTVKRINVLKYIISKTPNNKLLKQRIGSIGTPLAHAVRRCSENFDVIKLLVENGSDVNYRDYNGDSILHKYLMYSYESPQVLQILNYFMEKGIDLNAVDNDGYTPLDLTITHYSLADVNEFLLAKGAHCNVKQAVSKYLYNHFPRYSFHHTYNNDAKNLKLAKYANWLYNYFGIDIETKNNYIQEFQAFINTLLPENGHYKTCHLYLKLLNSWDNVATLRTLCLRIIKTGQAGDDYKAFAPGYFEWYYIDL